MNFLQRIGRSKFFKIILKIIQVGCFVVPFLLGIYIGFSVREPSSISEPLKEFQSAVGTYDDTLIAAKHNNRMITADIDELQKRTEALNKALKSTKPSPAVTSAAAAVDQTSKKLAESLQQQNQTYATNLIETQTATAAVRQKVTKLSDASHGWQIIIYDQLRRFMKWTGPVVFFIILGVVLFVILLSFKEIRHLFFRNSLIRIGTMSIEFKDVEAIRGTLREDFKQIDSEISLLYRKEVFSSKVSDQFTAVKVRLDKAIKDHGGADLSQLAHRATLYVPGFVGDDLVQATDYLGNKLNIGRPNAGRRFSFRYGIIGKAWRLQRGLYNPLVSNKKQGLIRKWGLTKSEADRQGAYEKSLLAMTIEDAGDYLGVIYLEAEGENSILPSKTLVELQTRLEDNSGCYWSDKWVQELVWPDLKASNELKELVKGLKELKQTLRWDNTLLNGDGR